MRYCCLVNDKSGFFRRNRQFLSVLLQLRDGAAHAGRRRLRARDGTQSVSANVDTFAGVVVQSAQSCAKPRAASSGFAPNCEAHL
jgi:hypothetical protein